MMLSDVKRLLLATESRASAVAQYCYAPVGILLILHDNAVLATDRRKALHEAILEDILEERVVSSRNRVNFRGVKRKMNNYNLRPRKRQPTRRLDVSKGIRIVK